MTKKLSPRRGIEPRSPAWQAGILTTILSRITAFSYSRNRGVSRTIDRVRTLPSFNEKNLATWCLSSQENTMRRYSQWNHQFRGSTCFLHHTLTGPIFKSFGHVYMWRHIGLIQKSLFHARRWFNPGENVVDRRVLRLCRNPGLNQGPLDFQSNALQTELFRPTKN